MSEFVLDCSVALAWALPDENSDLADEFLGAATYETKIWVPALWWYEVANALSGVRRQNRLSKANHVRLMSMFMNLPVRTDALFGQDAFFRYGSIGLEQGLSAYDAAYLELAFRRGIVLVTLDTKLAKEAEKSGLEVWSGR